MNDILKHRQEVKANIQRLFGEGIDCNSEFQKAQDAEIEKARHGTYADTAQNRRLNRVGQEYGHKAQEQEPSGKQSKGSGEDAGGKDYSSHAQGASDEALKRAAADEKADKGVRDAAKKELEKRGKSGGGDDGGEKEMSIREQDMRTWDDNQLKKVLDDDDYDEEDKRVAKDELSKRGGFNKKMEKVKQNLSSKLIGDGKRFSDEDEFDGFVNYIRINPESAYYYEANHPETAELVEAVAKEMGVKLPPRQKVIDKIKEDEEESRRAEEEWRAKERIKMAKDPAHAIERSVSLEWGEPSGRKERAMMKKVKDAAKEFLQKNPKLKMTMEDWDAIAEGVEDAPELQKLSSLEGYRELADAIDKYVDKEE